MAITNQQFKDLAPGDKIRAKLFKQALTVHRITGGLVTCETDAGETKILTQYEIMEVLPPDILKTQRPEVQGKMRQLLGIYESLTDLEQIFIKGILINTTKHS